MNATMTNGRMHNGHQHQTHQPRKQLSDQIDRLDVLVDGLADELPKAVADATREGTRLAVGDVLKEILTDPATIAHFRNLFAPSAPVTAPVTVPVTVPTPVVTPSEIAEPQHGVFARWKARIQDGAKAAIHGMKLYFAQLRQKIRDVKARITAATTTVRNILPVGRYLLIALGIGTTVASVCYIAPPEVSAVVSGIGGAAVALTVQLFRWVRRSAKSLILLK